MTRAHVIALLVLFDVAAALFALSLPRPANHFAIIYDARTRAMVAILNPDFEYEIDDYRLASGQAIKRLEKERFGIALKPNAMTLEDLRRIIESNPLQ